MSTALDWARDGASWPHHASSRFVDAGGLRWHVQQMGAGPVVLLLHGTGSATHSWRHLMPLLARHATVVALDLPGHAFTRAPAGGHLSLPAMAALVAALVARMAIDVKTVIGHSAGAAIAARMVLDGALAPSMQIAINGAFLPLPGLSGLVFPPIARLMAATPLAARLFARRHWSAAEVERLIRGTGSALDAEGCALYGLLMRDAAHAAAALDMMAHWDLQPLQRDLAHLKTPLSFIVGSHDRAVPPGDARRVSASLPVAMRGGITTIPGGHLVQEERAVDVATAMGSMMKG